MAARPLQGERLAAFGLTEPGGGSDIPGGMRTTARRDGDEWVINGSKAFITNSGTSITSVITVLAITGQVRRRPQISSIIVPAGTPGLTVGAEVLQGRLVRLGHQGTVASATAGCRPRNLLGEPGPGLRPVPADSGRGQDRDRGARRPAWPRAASTSACATCAERSAFGHRLGHYQSIQFKIADMQARAATARLAWYDAAARLVAGEPVKKQAAIAKLTASNAAMDNARDATQIFGGYGYMNEFPVARFYRDAKVLEIGEGTSEVQRMIIARELGLTDSHGHNAHQRTLVLGQASRCRVRLLGDHRRHVQLPA